MIRIMIIFTYVSTILAMISTAVVCLNYMFKTSTYAIDFTMVNKHIGTCRNASFVFLFLAWLTNSFESKNDCLKGYVELSQICLHLGYYWLIYAFVCIAICILMISIKKESTLVNGVAKFRNSGFLMAAIFLIVSFLLNVG